jgi:hypothetical protein
VMPIYEFTKSEACDLLYYYYPHQKKKDCLHQFSVAAYTDNRANFLSSNHHHRGFLSNNP